MMKIDNSIYEPEEADVVFIGFPRTISKTPNPLNRDAPDLLRFAINNKDDYDVVSNKNVFDILKISDIGNIKKFDADNYKEQTIIVFGGDHSITNDITNELMYKHKDMHIIVFDAHIDAREDGEENAKFLRKIVDRMPRENIHLIGQRVYSKEEKEYIDNNKIEIKDDINIKGKEVYISFDIDVVDDVFVPTCSTPEPLGKSLIYYIELIKKIVKNNKLIGIDFVEFSGREFDITYSNIATLVMEVLKQLMRNKIKEES